ncbi:hypothetical protein [Nocardiopsis suaedae]|uniref:Uncharacterized protein n=1 Tax=Nocardiopsis suaedae TaxID=3018444 RepID=A0ABT4TT63_9ACTN|nr:hypothetical protein [Nocardiopsis suaedae]MDA2807878.1 hypothetical protein [Nocardiopsis suaedae]
MDLSVKKPPERRRAARVRSYSRDRIPGFGRFCEVASRHRDDWSITYDYASPTPYRAQSRHREDALITASDVDVLDQALAVLAPIARPRVLPAQGGLWQHRAWSAPRREVA